MSEISFFLGNKGGEIARFEIYVEVFGWRHLLRGSIIESKRTNAPAVVWPKGQAQFFPHTPERNDVDKAEAEIMRLFENWCTT